jgi:hypothetical protein
VIVLFVMAPDRATAHDVFTSTYNGTGFSFGYVCCISILSTLFSFAGYEGTKKETIQNNNKKIFDFLAGAHLAEETRGAGRAGDFNLINILQYDHSVF